MTVGKCKLCLQVGDLQNSHLMPSSLFKKSRTPGAPNPNPMVVTDRRSVQTSRQLRNFVLCRNCEQLFSRKGEAYVMAQVFDGTKFPLLDVLLASTQAWRGSEFVGYDLAATPTIDREQLGYFALSFFGGRRYTSGVSRGRNPSRSIWVHTTSPSESTFWGRRGFHRMWCCSLSPAQMPYHIKVSTRRALEEGARTGLILSWRRASIS